MVSLAILVALNGWMLSGGERKKEDIVEQVIKLTTVKVESLSAVERSSSLQLFGQTIPAQEVVVLSGTSGEVESIPFDEGAFVEAQTVIAAIKNKDLRDELEFKKARVEQRRQELLSYEALGLKKLQSETSVSKARADFMQAKSEFTAALKMYNDSFIKAPFSGFIEERYIEEGERINTAAKAFKIIKTDPMKVQVFANEKQVGKISTGQNVSLKDLDGVTYEGTVSFVSRNSDSRSNTYRVEISVPNENGKLKGGKSLKSTFAVEQGQYINISPALFALDEDGKIGVKTVEDSIVKFVPIDLKDSDENGVWVNGLGDKAQVITLGQGFVRHGDKVNVSNGGSM